MFRVAHVTIEILTLPKFAVPLQKPVCFMTRKGFPRVQHVSQWKAFPRFNQRVNVIWHDAPGQKTIALSVEMKQRTLNQTRDVRLTQPATAMTGVEVFFHTPAKFHGTLTFGLKRKLGFPFLDDTCRHGIAEPEIYGLNHARMIPMRQVAA